MPDDQVEPENHEDNTHEDKEQEDRETISPETWTRALEEFINRHLRSSAVTRNTHGWNHLIDRFPRLREILNKELKR